jgi:DUF438 domain-containing protein
MPSSSIPRASELPSGHPLTVFRRENAALAGVVAHLRALAADLARAEAREGVDTDLRDAWRCAWADLRQLERHYSRKESLLFAYLERHGVVEPAREMWRLDHRIRRLLREAEQELDPDRNEGRTGWRTVEERIAPLLELVESMIRAEEEGLVPQCASLLTPAEWAEIHHESARYRLCLVDPGDDPGLPDDTPVSPQAGPRPGDPVVLSTGGATARQLDLMLRTLPCDLTLVDDEDRILYYSDGPHRAFSRTPAIIGRPLAHCHPPATEALLETMIGELRRGERDAIESVMRREDRWYHVRYLAMREPDGRYAGCLEMAQDITEIRRFGHDLEPPGYSEDSHRTGR